MSHSNLLPSPQGFETERSEGPNPTLSPGFPGLRPEKLAEREGFEPSVEGLPLLTLSRRAD